MDRQKMNALMLLLGFYESCDCNFTTEENGDGTFWSIKSLACQDILLRSPLEALLLERCDAQSGRLLQSHSFNNLDHMLRVKFPEKVGLFKRSYDPLEGLDVPTLGKKKEKKKKAREIEAREIFKQVIRLIAAQPAGPTPVSA